MDFTIYGFIYLISLLVSAELKMHYVSWTVFFLFSFFNFLALSYIALQFAPYFVNGGSYA